MKDDAINRLHGKPVKIELVLERFRWQCVPELANIPHCHSYCGYVQHRTQPGKTSRTKAETFPDIPTYGEYLKMKKERLRRYRISQALLERNLARQLGLTGSKLEAMIVVFRKNRLMKEGSW